jgi:hypothetical protein
MEINIQTTQEELLDTTCDEEENENESLKEKKKR